MTRAIFPGLQPLWRRNRFSQVLVGGDVDQVIPPEGGAGKTFMQGTLSARSVLRKSRRCRRAAVRAFMGRPARLARRQPYSAAPGRHTRVEILQAADVEAVAGLIDGAFRSAAEESGGKAPSLAVLLRHPGAAVQLENALAMRGYATETHGFEPYATRPEILFVRVLVAWATGHIDTLAHADLSSIQSALAEFTGCMRDRRYKHVNYKDLGAFHTYVLGDVRIFIARADTGDVAPIINASDGDVLGILRRFLARMQDLEPCELARLVQDSGFAGMARRSFVFDEQVDEAMASMLAFARSASGLTTFDTWLKQMRHRDADVRRGHAKGAQILRLYSIPAAKGLEFDHVLIPDVSAGSFDGRRQEERNLFYVAASRARRK